jgi:hypothetical protein
VQYSEIKPQKLFTTTSVTLCCQTTATTSMHSVCMMHTLMLGQLLAVATAAQDFLLLYCHATTPPLQFCSSVCEQVIAAPRIAELFSHGPVAAAARSPLTLRCWPGPIA